MKPRSTNESRWYTYRKEDKRIFMSRQLKKWCKRHINRIRRNQGKNDINEDQ